MVSFCFTEFLTNTARVRRTNQTATRFTTTADPYFTYRGARRGGFAFTTTACRNSAIKITTQTAATERIS